MAAERKEIGSVRGFGQRDDDSGWDAVGRHKAHPYAGRLVATIPLTSLPRLVAISGEIPAQRHGKVLRDDQPSCWDVAPGCTS
jgi:hypothetical protein